MVRVTLSRPPGAPNAPAGRSTSANTVLSGGPCRSTIARASAGGEGDHRVGRLRPPDLHGEHLVGGVRPGCGPRAGPSTPGADPRHPPTQAARSSARARAAPLARSVRPRDILSRCASATRFLSSCSPSSPRRSPRRRGTRPRCSRWSGAGAARRQLVQADTSLRAYQARAHGFVFFLAQVGSGPDRAAPAGEGGRAAAGSVLARPGPQQADHPRLARRHLAPHRHQLPPRPPRRRHQQLRQPHPDRRRRRGPRRAPSALAGGARGATTSRCRTRSPCWRTPARCRCTRWRSGPSRSPAPLVIGTLYLDVGHRRGRPVPLQLHAVGVPRSAARGHQHRPGERALRGPLLAARAPGDRDPAPHHLARLPGARHHPRPLGDRRLHAESRPSADGLRGTGDRRAQATGLRGHGPGPSRWPTRSPASPSRSTART